MPITLGFLFRGNGLIIFPLFLIGKIRLVYVLFGISPRIWNGLRTYTEVPLYTIEYIHIYIGYIYMCVYTHTYMYICIHIYSYITYIIPTTHKIHTLLYIVIIQYAPPVLPHSPFPLQLNTLYKVN
jgi:hypothetical protein